jgi:hemoglobin-like flavoprotein
MISLTLNQLHDPMNFQIIMRGLALSHCQKGVRSVEYGIVGSVLFHSLKKVLAEEYTEAVHQAWVKIYSAMLSIIVPMVVDHELLQDREQQLGQGQGQQVGRVRGIPGAGGGEGGAEARQSGTEEQEKLR